MKVVGIIIFYVICSILDDIIMGNISFKDWKSEKKIVIIVLFISILYGLADFIEDYMGLTFPLTLVMGVAGTIFGIIEAIFLYIKTKDKNEKEELLKGYLIVGIILILTIVD